MKYRNLVLVALPLVIGLAGITYATTYRAQRLINEVHPDLLRNDVGAKLDALITMNRELHTNVSELAYFSTADCVLESQWDGSGDPEALTGIGLSVDANAQDVESDDSVFVRYRGSTYLIAADAAVNINGNGSGVGSTCAGDTVAADGDGAFWVFAQIEDTGVLDIESNATAQDHASIEIALAQYSIADNTLPLANSVPVGCIQIGEASSAAWTIGTDSITAEDELYFSFSGLAAVTSECASITADSSAATYTYGAGGYRDGTGSDQYYSGAANQVLQAGTVATGKVGAWLIYVYTNDIEVAVPLGVAYDDLDGAREGVRTHTRNPLMACIGVIYVENRSGANFVGGTTNLDAANITTTTYVWPAFNLANTSVSSGLPAALPAD